MLDLSETNARLIIDAITMAIDGKPASAKTFSTAPFTELSDFGQWGQEHNNSARDTTRTDALTIAYLIFLELPPKDRTCSGLRLRADELAR
jgi:hypothetical protein